MGSLEVLGAAGALLPEEPLSPLPPEGAEEPLVEPELPEAEPEVELSLLPQAASRLRQRTKAKRIANAFFIDDLSFPLFKRVF
jgi:hypothetical protein